MNIVAESHLAALAGIESMFPKETYYAWYKQPTSAALQAAHDRVAKRLLMPTKLSSTQRWTESIANISSLERDRLGLLTPPGTSTSATPARSASEVPLYTTWGGQVRNIEDFSTANAASGHVNRHSLVDLVEGLETPDSSLGTASAGSRTDAGAGMYDGLICFSQGCAVSTGLLLELGAKVGCEGPLPVRFVILICGGRPFDRNGTMERVEAVSVQPIELSSIHIHGRQDPGLAESRRLASLYNECGKQVIELDIGHCPPRRSSDISVVAAAIRRAISALS